MKVLTRAFYRPFKRRSDHRRAKVSRRYRSPAKSAGKRSGGILTRDRIPGFDPGSDPGKVEKSHMQYAYVCAMCMRMCILCVCICGKKVKRYNENGNW